jgi:MFS family permease
MRQHASPTDNLSPAGEAHAPVHDAQEPGRPTASSAEPRLLEHDVERGKRALVRDAAWASLTGSLYGGVILVGFALDLGAGPFAVGVLAAIPFLAQIVQLPAVALVEHYRQRRKITVRAATAARMVILAAALLPLLRDEHARLAALFGAQIGVTTLSAIAGCSLNSWLHQLLPRENLGAFFARRLFWSTAIGALGALAAGIAIDRWPFGDRLQAYSCIFALAALAGFVSSWFLSRVPEPAMHRIGKPAPLLDTIGLPFRDHNFRKVIVFMGAWNVASNLAAPFLAVYLLTQLRFGLSTVTSLWVTSQIANAFTLYLWGRLSDRLSNKAILAVALPIYFLCTLGLVFTAIPARHALTLPLLYLIHLLMGAASGGIALATGNLGLKLAPHGKGTVYLANVSLVGSVAGGIASIVGGALAGWFASRELSITFHWTSPDVVKAVTVLQFQHWEFLFAISAGLGLYVMHALSRIEEGERISERLVVQQFVLEAFRTIDQLSSIEGLRLAILIPFARLFERRRYARRDTAASGKAMPR